jgi:nitroimidazol reductase NimA-like FMN-containing flavoprotein (pyridoxamine 5'-phosphate oxidase superfamily)
MSTDHDVRITVLEPADARTFLAGQHVGRLAFTLHDRVDIEPIHYVNEGDWLFGRTTRGTKLAKLLHQPWCAMEADLIHGLFDWTSVVAKGVFYILDPDDRTNDRYARAEELLRQLVPGSLTAQDPAPRRTTVFGIFVHELTGRTATPH